MLKAVTAPAAQHQLAKNIIQLKADGHTRQYIQVFKGNRLGMGPGQRMQMLQRGLPAGLPVNAGKVVFNVQSAFLIQDSHSKTDINISVIKLLTGTRIPMQIKSPMLTPDLDVRNRQPDRSQAVPADTEAKDGMGSVLHDRQKKQLQDMQATAQALQQMKKSNSPKQRATQRAAMLKQRLEALKSVLSKLPPGDYKALLQELKQIAKELKALSKQLGNSGAASAGMPGLATAFNRAVQGTDTVQVADVANMGEMAADTGQIPVQAVPAAEAVAAEVPDDEIPTDADIAVTDAETAVDENQLSEAAHAADKSAHHPARVAGQSSEDDEDKQLRTVLEEAKRLLKEALNLLRAKHQPDDQDSRKLIKDIEDELEKLEQQLPALAAADSSNIEADTDTGNLDSASIGGFVDTNV